jgi:O-antigen biosynthesis protein
MKRNRKNPPEGFRKSHSGSVDAPTDWKKLPRRFRLAGWCFSKTGEKIEVIRARLGPKEFAGNYGLFRADVAAAHEDRPGSFKSGFDIIVDAPRGVAILQLEVRESDGVWKEIFSKKIRGPLINLRRSLDLEKSPIGDYATWIKQYDTLGLNDRRKIKAHIRTLEKRPLISIAMPVYNPNPDHLRRAIKSVLSQLYSHWELCIVDDASTAEHVRPILTRFAKLDGRIKLQFRKNNGGIAAASNEAIAMAGGEFVALLDDDDELAPTALYFVALEINHHPDARLIYSDEDKLDIAGNRTNPHFKSDWNWLLYLAQNFFCHLAVFHSPLIKQLGFRGGFEGSQDYDLVLRCLEHIEPRQIHHIPRVLYHWRMSAGSAALNLEAKPEARASAIKTVQEYLDRNRIAADVVRTELEDFQRICFPLPPEKPRVCIIIPTKDMVETLRPCVQSILEKTIYPAFEILLVDNGSRESAALAYLEEIARDFRVRILPCPEEFNYGRLNNLGVQHTEAEFIALLNNDLTVINPDWLSEMVSQGLRPNVGAIGARLLFPDGGIQHSGVILGAGGGGVADHAHKGLPRGNYGYFARAMLAQELSAVTAACMLVRRRIYLEVGGFDEEHLKIAFNDVDFCLRLTQHGYRIIYTPYAELYHLESASRGLEDTMQKYRRFYDEVAYIKETWKDKLSSDPFYNPNLSLNPDLFTLAFPPRLTKPWEAPPKAGLPK